MTAAILGIMHNYLLAFLHYWYFVVAGGVGIMIAQFYD